MINVYIMLKTIFQHNSVAKKNVDQSQAYLPSRNLQIQYIYHIFKVINYKFMTANTKRSLSDKPSLSFINS